MGTLPQLIEEDIGAFDAALGTLLKATDATTALVIDQGGFLITHFGDSEQFDLTTIAALASGAYLANQTIANLVQEPTFDSVYQHGQKFSIFATAVDAQCLLVVIFDDRTGVGIVKYYAAQAVVALARQLQLAHDRNPEGGLDLSVMNLADSSVLFRKAPDPAG